ncbi:MAG: ComF family protein [Candidatus Cloacimonadales bacterium]
MKIIDTFLNLIFPGICPGCGSSISGAEVVCAACVQKLVWREQTTEPGDFSFERSLAVFDFTPLVQQLIHEFKYNEMRSLGKFLATEAANFLQAQADLPQIDLVVPVPLHRVKKRFRGFNQAEILSQTIAKKCGYQHFPQALARKRFTQTQTQLNRQERQQNVAQAFGSKYRQKLVGKTVLLVDDVFTTGATTNTISNVLKNNGVSQIIVLTIARA